jgi:transposase-like protein
MSRSSPRPDAFPTGVVLLAVERKDRTGESWTQIARELGVSPGTLRARVSDYRHAAGAQKADLGPSKGSGTGSDTFPASKDGVP